MIAWTCIIVVGTATASELISISLFYCHHVRSVMAGYLQNGFYSVNGASIRVALDRRFF